MSPYFCSSNQYSHFIDFHVQLLLLTSDPAHSIDDDRTLSTRIAPEGFERLQIPINVSVTICLTIIHHVLWVTHVCERRP